MVLIDGDAIDEDPNVRRDEIIDDGVGSRSSSLSSSVSGVNRKR
jgi:hypothetical protein